MSNLPKSYQKPKEAIKPSHRNPREPPLSNRQKSSTDTPPKARSHRSHQAPKTTQTNSQKTQKPPKPSHRNIQKPPIGVLRRSYPKKGILHQQTHMVTPAASNIRRNMFGPEHSSQPCLRCLMFLGLEATNGAQSRKQGVSCVISMWSRLMGLHHPGAQTPNTQLESGPGLPLDTLYINSS